MKLRYIAALTVSVLAAQAYAQTTSPDNKKEAQPASSPPSTSQPASSSNASKEQSSLSDKEKLSYTIGQNLGRSFKQQEIDLNMANFVKGIEDALSDNKPLLSSQEMSKIMMEFQKERFAKQATKRKEQAEDNLKKGQAFLEENKKKEGVVVLPSGLQYKVIKEGTGKTPTAEDKVTTNYRGTLTDGSEFDSSYSRGQPATFPVKGVIKGWTEALQLMKEGAKWQLFVPASLAYGEQGVLGGKIGPNATLIFDIELISIEAADKSLPKLESPKKEESTTEKKEEPTTEKKEEHSESEKGKD